MNGTFVTKAIRFDGALDLLDPAPVPFTSVLLAALVGNGSGFYAVWNQQQTDGSVAVTGTRVSPAGARLDGTGLNISGTREPQYQATTAVAWDGSGWRVTWGNGGVLRAARVNAAGQVLDPGGVAVTGPQTGLTAGNGAGGLEVVWMAYAAGGNDVHGASLSPAFAPGPTRTLSLGAPRQTRPDVALGAGGSMLVFRSVTAAASRVLAQPLGAGGDPLTAQPVVLDSGDP